MILRKLKLQDAEPMLEWMHDPEVVSHLKGNFAEKTLTDCQTFIRNSAEDSENVHFAIADDRDHYMGTVSLKHIQKDFAEFAIVICKGAMGTGASREAMGRILEYGIRELKLPAVYWCVSQKNTRAVRFYDKNGYVRADTIPVQLEELYAPQKGYLLWYCYDGN